MFRRLSNQIKHSIVVRSIQVLPRTDRRKILLVMTLQVTLAFLDLVGVAVIGVIGALSVRGVQSLPPGDRVSELLEILGLSDVSFQNQVAILAGCASLVLIFRTILSILITRSTFFFLSRRGAVISSKLVSRLLSQPIIKVQERSMQETVYAVTTGVTAITLGVIGTSITIVADSSLLMIMIIALFFVDPVIALTSILFFGSLGYALYRQMNVKAYNLGYLNSELSIESNERIFEVLQSYRELIVRNRLEFYAREIKSLRLKLADVLAEIQFMPNVSKYVIESGIVIGAVLIAGVQFALQDARQAIATLAIFLAAGTRIAPAIMRLQQSLVQIRGGVGTAKPTLELIDSLVGVHESTEVKDTLDTRHFGFNSEVILKSVDMKYPGNEVSALISVDLKISEGESVALVGPSGAGKTSIVDVLLGVLPPDNGRVSVSGLPPLEAIAKWPGAIAYVPQDVAILNGTFRENVGMGYPKEIATDDLVWEALEVAQLADFVRSLPLNLDTPVGERGTRISGGQRQRLGIARAMFTKPKLLVLDEATSALDGQTESDISDAIKELHGLVTVVMIAHRLSTVKHSDQVVYMAKGKIVASGTFNEVRSQVSDFDRQAQLMGL
jgi:ABC-type multidrug transport system fused ATPase/permease subunit